MKYVLILSIFIVARLTATDYGVKNQAVHQELVKAEQRVFNHCRALIDYKSCKNA